MAVINFKGAREAPKSKRSTMQTLLLTREEIDQWRIPGFQRPVRVNDKVKALAESLKEDGGIISGVITIGSLVGSAVHYVVDGQHRLEGFRISELKECIADVRSMVFESMADMAEEFVDLNTALVKMRPDDVLRGLEGSSPGMKAIRSMCPFVGYDQIRRGTGSSSLLSMSATIRCWVGSSTETPGGGNSGRSAAQLGREIEDHPSDLIAFLLLARQAWGDDHAYFRLWSNLNLTICMWMWRRLVLDQERRGNKRFVKLTHDQFKKCLMATSADSSYLDWLVGRNLGDRDRSPCYRRLRQIFVARMQDLTGTKIIMPSPSWAAS